MQFINYLKRKTPLIAGLGLLFGLSSCGSYQYVGVDNDGIYGSSNPHVEYQEAVVEVQNNTSGNNYYKNYFREKSLEYDNLVNDNAIFTDIDDYESAYVENDTIDNSYQGYAGWGQSNSNVTINYIDNGWNNWGWNAGFGLGWNSWRWNRWNNWGWNNWGYYDPYYPYYGGFYSSWSYYNPYSYYNYGYPYYNNYYSYNNYRSRGVSYSASRRGSMASNYNSNLTNKSTAVKNTSRYNTTRRSNTSAYTNSNTVNRVNSSTGNNTYNSTQRRVSSVSTPTTNSTTRTSSTTRNSSQPSATYNNSNLRRSSETVSTPSRTYNSGSSNNSGSSRSSSSSNSGVSRSSSSSSSGSSGSSGGGRRRG